MGSLFGGIMYMEVSMKGYERHLPPNGQCFSSTNGHGGMSQELLKVESLLFILMPLFLNCQHFLSTGGIC